MLENAGVFWRRRDQKRGGQRNSDSPVERTAATGELSCRRVGHSSPAATKTGQSFVLMQVHAELGQRISSS